MKPATPELVATPEERAMIAANPVLALRTLFLREGIDDFIGDACLLADIAKAEEPHLRELLTKSSQVIENDHPSVGVLYARDLIASLEFQLLFARRLEAFLQADVERGQREEQAK